MAMDTFNHVKKNGNHFLGEAKDKYMGMKDALEDIALQSKKSFYKMKKNTTAALSDANEKIKDTAYTVNKKAHKNPWAFIAAASLGALLAGYVAGKCSKKERSW